MYVVIIFIHSVFDILYCKTSIHNKTLKIDIRYIFKFILRLNLYITCLLFNVYVDYGRCQNEIRQKEFGQKNLNRRKVFNINTM